MLRHSLFAAKLARHDSNLGFLNIGFLTIGSVNSDFLEPFSKASAPEKSNSNG
jgi:hypothetical protein